MIGAHHWQDVLLELLLATSFKHPRLGLRETPGEGVGDTAKLFPERNLALHRQFETAMTFRHVDRRETKFNRSFLVTRRYFMRQHTVIELCLDFVRLKIFICIRATDALPLPGIFAYWYFHLVLVTKNFSGSSGAASR